MNQLSQSVQHKAILVISSHVVRGSVGNRAVAFTLEVLGHPVWTLPTITLPWHPGHGKGTRITANEEEFRALCDDLAGSNWTGEIAGVISGFMASPTQAGIVADLICRLKSLNKNLIYLCDPVIGDFVNDADQPNRSTYGVSGRLYIAPETAQSIRSKLLPLADIATPNLFELAWLTRQDQIKNQNQMLVLGRELMEKTRIRNLLITSVPAMMRGSIGTVLIAQTQAIMSEHKALPNPPNGLGDLTSALFISHFLQGLEVEKNLEKTTASVFEVLARTAQQQADELMLESNIISLSRPMAMVNLRRLKLPLAI